MEIKGIVEDEAQKPLLGKFEIILDEILNHLKYVRDILQRIKEEKLLDNFKKLNFMEEKSQTSTKTVK